MKKFAVLGLAVVLVIAFTVPAMAIESVFGGYWRTRAYTQQNFTGEDETEAKDVTLVDTRTRLYYTAIFNENFKFVNKFEFDAAWGGTSTGYGDIGADGKDVEVKNSYVDFTLGAVNSKIGVQSYKLGRGLVFNDDFAGAVITYKAEAFELPFFWIKAYEGTGIESTTTARSLVYNDDGTVSWADSTTTTDYDNDYDVDYYGIAPKFSLGDMGSIQPMFIYAYSDDAGKMAWPSAGLDEVELFYLGFDADLNFDPVSLWLTAVYQFGSVEGVDDVGAFDTDISAWLLAIGAKANFDTFDIHGQAFYTSGDDDAEDEDYEQYFSLRGQDYHWAEIMGGGIFDAAVAGASSNGTTYSGGYNNITNIMAFNLGAGFKATDDLSLKLDVWYAQLVEEAVAGLDEELGTEVDLVATYKLMPGLTLDLVGAYLFAGDSVTLDSPDDENPYEVGAQLSLSF